MNAGVFSVWDFGNNSILNCAAHKRDLLIVPLTLLSDGRRWQEPAVARHELLDQLDEVHPLAQLLTAPYTNLHSLTVSSSPSLMFLNFDCKICPLTRKIRSFPSTHRPLPSEP